MDTDRHGDASICVDMCNIYIYIYVCNTINIYNIYIYISVCVICALHFEH